MHRPIYRQTDTENVKQPWDQQTTHFAHSWLLKTSLAFPLSVSLVPTLPLLLGILNSYLCWTIHCATLLILTTPVLKAVIKLTKVKSYDNNVCHIIIEHVISVYSKSNKQADAENVTLP